MLPTHLSKEVDASSNNEGRNRCADHSKEADGANVLKEVALDKHERVIIHQTLLITTNSLLFISCYTKS